MPLFTVMLTFADHRIGIEQYEADSPYTAMFKFIENSGSLDGYDRKWLAEKNSLDRCNPLIHVADGMRGFWIWVASIPENCEDIWHLGGHIIQTDPNGPLRPSA